MVCVPGILMPVCVFNGKDLVTAPQGRAQISTLMPETRPALDRFLTFKEYAPCSERQMRCQQRARKDGVYFGPVSMNISLMGWDEDRPIPKQLCPYFDPSSKTLRYLQLDGERFFERRERHLADLLNLTSYRPLLALAHAEGLLDKMPGQCLQAASVSPQGMKLILYLSQRIPWRRSNSTRCWTAATMSVHINIDGSRGAGKMGCLSLPFAFTGSRGGSV